MTQLDVRDAAHTIPLDGVRVRPYGAADGARLRGMSARLSPAGLYARFFSGTPHIPDHYITIMNGLDHWDRDALVALLDGDMIGIAEYCRDADRPARADIAVLVCDPWRRRGVATVLIGFLAELAGRRGVREFGADVLPGNREALMALHSMWPDALPVYRDGLARYLLPLPGRPG
ncbi:GNAT family N-acetyltransferase [Actinomadura algeriensis]|uniref:GNAT superfamily N-acetyltransferase n=1 Tax=Actinomadura algeriensis TaxID=1679523 RepID=A0ABR9JQC1_9ACTN|nr:GNAT family N-acetyltransferase [Actinomadura algeriensis]MBE1532678.1 GNAT superfamily N-acetyltransferase [Actinomadura algeriensis]